uniref:CHK kinase-like domain-containing protein n=1 Tax=Graphocephala atropunctata TaxID=36148 RepID=A0A1B6LGH6_9HEMI
MTWEVPSWLNESFLTTVLQGDVNTQNVSITKFSVKPALGLGENYSSQIFRAIVEYKTKESAKDQFISLIIKAPHTKGLAAELIGMLDVVDKEKRVYTELLPRIYDKINHEFGPKYLNCPLDDVLVLQDLNEEGYEMAKRHQQLDFSHCALVLSSLAKYHACSVPILKETPTLVQSLGTESLYSNDSLIGQQMKGWVAPCLNIVSEIFKNMDGCEEYVELLSNKQDIWDSLVESFKPREDRLNVLNHGDFWVNNMLFKYNHSGVVTEAKLIDFAVPRYMSPAADIVYFIWSSANEEVREDRIEELVDVYLHSLNTTLEQLRCEERLSKAELTKEMKSLSEWALSLICQFLPMVLTDPKDAINLENLTMEDIDVVNPSQQMVQIFQGKQFLAALPTALRHYKKWAST